MDGSDDLTPVVLPKKPLLNLSDKSVPEINVESLPLDSAEAQSKFAESLRATFFDKSGCVILRNVFKPNVSSLLLALGILRLAVELTRPSADNE